VIFKHIFPELSRRRENPACNQNHLLCENFHAHM